MRLGLHVNKAVTGSEADRLARDNIRRVKARGKVMDEAFNREFIAYCKQQGSQVIGRVYIHEGDQRLEPAGCDGRIARIREKALEFPDIDWWELYNECHDGRNRIGAYGQACIPAGWPGAGESEGRRAAGRAGAGTRNAGPTITRLTSTARWSNAASSRTTRRGLR